MPGAYDGIVVIDLSRDYAGALAAMMLGDMGATVIKVEDTAAAAERPVAFRVWDRNKESVSLNLSHPDGRAALERLLAGADVAVDDRSRREAAEADLVPAEVVTRFPRLVFCSVPPFAHEGPYAELPGNDGLVQARLGIMDESGFRPGFTYGIHHLPSYGSAMLAVSGAAAALLTREGSGWGQVVSVPLVNGAMAVQGGVLGVNGAQLPVSANRSPYGGRPLYRFYPCEDGLYLMIGCINDGFWQKLAAVVGLEEFALDPRYFGVWGTNLDDLRVMESVVGAVIRQRTRQEWLDLLIAADVPVSPATELEAMFDAPQAQANGMVVALDDPLLGPVRMMGAPIRFADTPAAVRAAAPLPGQHTEGVLVGLGYSAGEIAALRAAGAAS